MISARDPQYVRLQQAIDALSLEASAEIPEQLLRYLDLLQRWNRTYNLTAIRDESDMLVQHLFDCLAVIAPLRRVAGPVPSRLLDVGSGGGLPGVVIAVMHPHTQVVCVDTVGKKAAFVRQVAAELGLKNLHAEHARVESLRAEPFGIVTSRAFASLTDFTRLTRPHLTRGPQGAADGIWMAMKGRNPDAEMAALPSDVEVFHVEPLRVPELNAERCLVWMRPARV